MRGEFVNRIREFFGACVIEESSCLGFDDGVQRSAGASCDDRTATCLRFDGGHPEVLDLWLDQRFRRTEQRSDLGIREEAVESRCLSVFWIAWFRSIGTSSDNVDRESEHPRGIDREVNAFVGLERADIQQAFVSLRLVGSEVIGADRWMDDHGFALVDRFNLPSDEVGVRNELGHMRSGSFVPGAQRITEVIESRGAELGLESTLRRVLLAL